MQATCARLLRLILCQVRRHRVRVAGKFGCARNQARLLREDEFAVNVLGRAIALAALLESWAGPGFGHLAQQQQLRSRRAHSAGSTAAARRQRPNHPGIGAGETPTNSSRFFGSSHQPGRSPSSRPPPPSQPARRQPQPPNTQATAARSRAARALARFVVHVNFVRSRSRSRTPREIWSPASPGATSRSTRTTPASRCAYSASIPSRSPLPLSSTRPCPRTSWPR